MLQIPYGQSYFPTIRRERHVYVDKTCVGATALYFREPGQKTREARVEDP